MQVKAHTKKWFGTKDSWTTSLWVEFNYSDLKEIMELPDIFYIYLSTDEDTMQFKACINQESKKPIVIETEEDKYSFAKHNWRFDIQNPRLCLLKIDVFINDYVCWMLRSLTIHINEDPSIAQFWELD